MLIPVILDLERRMSSSQPMYLSKTLARTGLIHVNSPHPEKLSWRLNSSSIRQLLLQHKVTCMSLDSYRQILSNKKMEIDEKMWMGDRELWKTVYIGVSESFSQLVSLTNT